MGREQRRQRLSWQGDFRTAAGRLGAQSDQPAMIPRTAAVAGWLGDLLLAFLSIIRKYRPNWIMSGWWRAVVTMGIVDANDER